VTFQQKSQNSQTGPFIVFAYSIHTGGGRIVLDEVLQNEYFGRPKVVFLDQRYPLPKLSKDIQVKVYPPTFWGRLKSHLDLKRLTNNEEFRHATILCYGNQPPYFKLASTARVIVYVQNCFLIPELPLPQDSWRARIRNYLERKLLYSRRAHFDEVWVQIPWMQERLKVYLGEKTFQIKPVLPSLPPAIRKPLEFDFVNVTSFSLHKNLKTLLDAASILDTQVSRRLRIHLVLDAPAGERVFSLPDFKNLEVRISYTLSREQLFDVYSRSGAAIINSSYESFSLPLKEAEHFGLSLICLRAGYTSEIANKTYYYDTNDPRLLAQAMLAYVKDSSTDRS